MKELMYDLPSAVIAALLFLSMAVAMEIGCRLGFGRRGTDDWFSSHINGTQASVLGILALLLGFTLSIALQRHDRRSEAVVDEANAIGTAYLRAQLLSPDAREDMRSLLRDYVAVRVRERTLSLADHEDRATLVIEGNRLAVALWDRTVRAAHEDPRPSATGLFIPALNDMLDATSRRDAELGRHVPELVLFALYGTFVIAGAIIGYAAGIGSRRPSLVTFVLVALIVVIVFIIIDLDRPRRGVITVNHQSLLDVARSMQAVVTYPPAPAPASRNGPR